MAIRATKPITVYDQAVFEDHLFRALDVFIPAVRKWYEEYYEHVFELVGCNPIADAPNGLQCRFSMSEKHSAIKGLQAFPFVSVMQLNLPPAPGGIRNMVRSILGSDYYKYGDIYLILKQSLVNTNNAGQFIAFITEGFFEQLPKGRFVWLNESDLMSLMRRVVPKALSQKILGWSTEAQRRQFMRSIMEGEQSTVFVDEDLVDETDDFE